MVNIGRAYSNYIETYPITCLGLGAVEAYLSKTKFYIYLGPPAMPPTPKNILVLLKLIDFISFGVFYAF